MSDAGRSSLAELLEGGRRGLKATLTKVTNRDGTVVVYDHDVVVNVDKGVTGHGFVVDTKPDLSFGDITPWFLISSQDVPADPSLLTELKVTHVLSLLPGFILPANVDSIKQLCVDLYDEECSLLDDTTLKAAVEFIREGKMNCGRVLIHCNAGISRAPSVAMFYLMTMEGMAFDTAWELVKSARPIAKPNAGFWNQLKNYQKGIL